MQTQPEVHLHNYSDGLEFPVPLAGLALLHGPYQEPIPFFTLPSGLSALFMSEPRESTVHKGILASGSQVVAFSLVLAGPSWKALRV